MFSHVTHYDGSYYMANCTDPKVLFSSHNKFWFCLEHPKDSLQIAHTINECMQEYCFSPNQLLGGCPYENITDLPSGHSKYTRDTNPFTLPNNFASSGACNVRVTVNPDIGGIGVSRTPALSDYQC